MLLSNLETLPEYRVIKHLGLVQGSTVRSKHAGRDLMASVKNVFGGELRGYEAERQLDDGIIAARWLTLAEVKETQARHRSPLILRCVEDQIAGKRYPLDLLVHYD